MKSIAFLLIASILFFFMGLLISEGRAPRQELQATDSIPALVAAPARSPKAGDGSANLKNSPPTPVSIKSAMAQAIETDNLCLAAQTVGRTFHDKNPEEVRGALRAFGAPSSLQEMVAENGPLYGPVDAKKRFSSAFLNLMYAFRLAGLYIESKHQKANDTAALTILKELEAADPSNGAYPFFQLAILNRNEAKKEEQLETAERIARASYFDTMLTAQLAEFDSQRWQSPTHAYAVDWLVGYVRQIRYYAGYDAVISVANGPQGEDLRNRIGRLMTQEGLRARVRAQRGGYDSDAYTYGTLLTTEEDPYTDQLSNEIAGSEWKYPPFVSRDGGDCMRELFDDYYEEMRGLP